MKVAVLLYGRMHKCVEFYNNFIKVRDKGCSYDYFMSSDDSPPDQINNFIHLYNPKSYTNEKIINNYSFIKRAFIHHVLIERMVPHFVNKRRVFDLLEKYVEENNIHYDIVISIRADLAFNTSQFNFIIPQENTIYIPNCYDYVPNAINDQVAYGLFNTMQRHSKICDNMLYLTEHKNIPAHPESLTLANINHYNLKIVRFDLDYFIIR
jgi:hypothetical protein